MTNDRSELIAKIARRLYSYMIDEEWLCEPEIVDQSEVPGSWERALNDHQRLCLSLAEISIEVAKE